MIERVEKFFFLSFFFFFVHFSPWTLHLTSSPCFIEWLYKLCNPFLSRYSSTIIASGSVNKRLILHCPRLALVGVHTLQSGVWKTALQFSPSRRGNSCQLLECSRENKQCLGCSPRLPVLPLLTLCFNPSPLETLGVQQSRQNRRGGSKSE